MISNHEKHKKHEKKYLVNFSWLIKNFTLKKALLIFLLGYIVFFVSRYKRELTLIFEKNGKYRSNVILSERNWTQKRESVNYLEGYTKSNSAALDGDIEIVISTDQKNVTGKIIRWGVQKSPFPWKIQERPTGKIRNCGKVIQDLGRIREKCITLHIKKSWEVGVYILHLESTNENKNDLETNIIFIVRPEILGSVSNTAVILATNTWQAYNYYPNNGRFPYGGFYRPNPYGAISSVTFNRPYGVPVQGFVGFPYAFYRYVASLIHILERYNYRCEFLAEDDIWDKDMILPYKTLIFPDHTEYITVDEQDNIIRFLENGGNLILASANSFYVEISSANKGRTLSLMWDGKNRMSSFFGFKEHKAYGRFYPESKITGIGFRHNAKHIEAFYLPYTVVKPEHWIYEGTGLKKSERFGSFGGERDTVNKYSPDVEILAKAVWEKDSYVKYFFRNLPFNMRIKRVTLDLIKIFIKQFIPSSWFSKKISGIPVSRILRTYTLNPVYNDLLSAQLVYYRHPAGGGHVFSFGTTHWNWNMIPLNTLKEDLVLSRIFRNVLKRCNVKKKNGRS